MTAKHSARTTKLVRKVKAARARCIARRDIYQQLGRDRHALRWSSAEFALATYLNKLMMDGE